MSASAFATDPWDGFAAAPLTPERVAPSGSALVDRIVQELRSDLARVARRASAAGPAAVGTVLLVTGCRRGVGGTTVALALAQAAAANQTVLLIDGDHTEPGLAAALGFLPSRGWDDALDGSCSLDDAFYPVHTAPQLMILPLRRPVAQPARLLADPAFGGAQGPLRRTYDLLILDGGSVGNGGAAWAPWADVALVVCDSGNKLADDWARAWDQLEAGGTQVLGIVETLG